MAKARCRRQWRSCLVRKAALFMNSSQCRRTCVFRRFPGRLSKGLDREYIVYYLRGSTAALAPDSSALGESGGPYLDMHGAPRAYDCCHWEVYIKELLAGVFTTWACYDNLMEMESSLLKLTHSLDSGLLKKRKRAAPKQLLIGILSNKSGANHYDRKRFSFS